MLQPLPKRSLQMKRDPIVEQVRKARSALVQRYGGDIDALYDALASLHEPGARYVAFAPKRILGSGTAAGTLYVVTSGRSGTANENSDR